MFLGRKPDDLSDMEKLLAQESDEDNIADRVEKQQIQRDEENKQVKPQRKNRWGF